MEQQNWQTKVIENVMLAAIKEQRSSRRFKIFFRVIWLVLIGVLIYHFFNLGNKSNPIAKNGVQIGLVELSGVISRENNTYDSVADGLNSALKDKDTVAVIIRANSPGGSPAYSDMLYNEILRQRKVYPKKPIYVVTEEVCASGCYYIASAANKIYANPSSIIGSIGVIYSGFGMTGLMQKLGVDSRLIISGRNKAMGYPFVAENKEQTQMQQVMLDEVHQQFIDAVKKGRGNKLVLSDPDLFSGRYWVGQDALKLGLIDGFNTVDGIAREQYKSENLVDFTPDKDSLDRLTKKLGLNIVSFAKQALQLKGDDNQFGEFR
jgi:protease IV